VRSRLTDHGAYGNDPPTPLHRRRARTLGGPQGDAFKAFIDTNPAPPADVGKKVSGTVQWLRPGVLGRARHLLGGAARQICGMPNCWISAPRNVQQSRPDMNTPCRTRKSGSIGDVRVNQVKQK
jgi:hypothetical protein